MRRRLMKPKRHLLACLFLLAAVLASHAIDSDEREESASAEEELHLSEDRARDPSPASSFPPLVSQTPEIEVGGEGKQKGENEKENDFASGVAGASSRGAGGETDTPEGSFLPLRSHGASFPDFDEGPDDEAEARQDFDLDSEDGSESEGDHEDGREKEKKKKENEERRHLSASSVSSNAQAKVSPRQEDVPLATDMTPLSTSPEHPSFHFDFRAEFEPALGLADSTALGGSGGSDAFGGSLVAAAAASAAEELEALALQAKKALEAAEEAKKNGKCSFGPTEPLKNMLQQKDLLDNDFSRYRVSVTLFSARLGHLRQRVMNEAAAVKELASLFSKRSKEAIAHIQAQYTAFGRSLERLEEEVSSLLLPEKGMVSSILSAYEEHLRSLAQSATAAFESRVTHVVERLEDTNTRLGSLLQLAVEAKALLLSHAQQLEARTSNTSNLFNFLSRRELETSAAAQRALAIEQLEGFKRQLAGMTLKEHVLEGLVDAYLQKRASLRDSRGVPPDLSLLDVSSLFDGPRANSVCNVLTHLLQKKAPHQEIATVFIQLASPTSATSALAASSSVTTNSALHAPTASNAGAVALLGSLGALPPNVVTVPPASAIIAAARLWKRRTDVYGHKGHAYAVVRIEGALVEVFTVPFLESEPYSLVADEALQFVAASDLPSRLEELVNALGINAAMNSLPEALVVYLGAVPNSEGGTPPSRRRSQQRIDLLRSLSPSASSRNPHLDLSSPVAAAFWSGSHLQLLFIENAETLMKKHLASGLAAQVSVRRLDAEVLVLASSADTLAPPPCRLGPHLREAFHVLQVRQQTRVWKRKKSVLVRLVALSEDSFVVPSDSVIANAVATLTRSVSVGAPSCAVAASCSWIPPERFWRKPQYFCELLFQSPSTNAFSRVPPMEGLGPTASDVAGVQTKASSPVNHRALLSDRGGLDVERHTETIAGRGASSFFEAFLSSNQQGRGESPQSLFAGAPTAAGFASSLGGTSARAGSIAVDSSVREAGADGSEVTAHLMKKTSLPAIVASLAQTVERVLLFSEAWARGFSLFVLICVEGKDCPPMRRH